MYCSITHLHRSYTCRTCRSVVHGVNTYTHSGPADYSGGTFTAEFGTEAGARFCQNIQTVLDTDTEPVDETFLVNIMVFPGSLLQTGTPGTTRVFITGMIVFIVF